MCPALPDLSLPHFTAHAVSLLWARILKGHPDMTSSGSVLRVGNCSGFYGDRHSAMKEMLTSGELDILTGDYLSELTMLILARDRSKNPATGYAKTFLRQMEECLGLALEKGVRIVVNAGGVNPAGLVTALRKIADNLGLQPRIAYVEGDDITSRASELGLGSPLSANAYLGAFGIAAGLDADADIVVTGRVTDASVIVGPAISHFGWGRDDYDQLAGATVAGHIIECGTQATGGNFSFFTEIPDLVHPGFPIVEISSDGSSVVTKHPGTAGAVTIDTVLAQLLYEITDARYAGPDVTTRLDSIELSSEGTDRVRVTGVRGEAPPHDLKVSLNSVGGIRNEITMVLTGLDIEAKADLIRRQVEHALPVTPRELTWRLARTDRADASTEELASARLTVIGRDSDPATVGRMFSNSVVEIALGTAPGFFMTSPPSNGQAYGVFTPGYVPQTTVEHVAVLPDGRRVVIPAPKVTMTLLPAHTEDLPGSDSSADDVLTRRVPLGTIAGARSGDKGGNANVGVWVRSDEEFDWLSATLTVEKLKHLLPECSDFEVTRTILPNLRAINFVVVGLLGEGVAYNARFDPQAKGIGEWLRTRFIEIPIALLPAAEQ